MASITGRADVLFNGVMLLNKAGAIAHNIGPADGPPVERTEVMGDSGFHGMTEEVLMAECEVTVTDRSDIMLSPLLSAKGEATVIFRARGGGKAYIMPEAWSTGNTSVTAGEGEAPLRFKAEKWVETTEI